MRTAIDVAGRVVIPKPFGDALGLTAGQPLEIAERDGSLEIAPAPTPTKLVDTEMPLLTAEMVRDTMERTRR